MNANRPFLLAAAAGILTLAVAALAQTKPTPAAKGRTLGTPKTYLNLTLVPVIDQRRLPVGKYMTLDEALARKVVKVREAGSGGEVNTLHITNYGDHPVYIIGGEVVLGGQQDRCVGKDIIIGAKEKNVPVPVFCVEHNRWTGSGDFSASAKMVASPEIRMSAQEGVFAQKVAAAGPARAGRTSVSGVGEAQSKVWDTVARKSSRLNAAMPTGTYRGVLQQSAGDAGKRIGPYLKGFSAGLGSDPHIVGVVALIDGKVASADIFADPALFRKLWPKLLRSYAADAAENARPKVADVNARDIAWKFIANPSARARVVVDRMQAGQAQRVDSDGRVFYRTLGTAGGAAAAAPVHENILRK